MRKRSDIQMKNNKGISRQVYVMILVILGVLFRYLPSKLQIGIGVPVFGGLIIFAFLVKETFYLKLIMIIVSAVVILYLLSIGTSSPLLKGLFPIIGAFAFIILLVIPKIHGYPTNSETKKWTIGDIIALVIFSAMFILLLVSKIILLIIG